MPYKDKQDQKRHYINNKEDYYFRNCFSKFGLTKENFFELLIEQDNKCALCKRTFEGFKRNLIHVDHCHKTDKVRGLLCMPCNVGLGMLGDNKEGLERALKYIRGSK